MALVACSSPAIPPDAAVRDASATDSAAPDGGHDAGTGLSRDEWADALVRYWCRTLRYCGLTDATSVAEQTAYADVESCVRAGGPYAHIIGPRVEPDPMPVPDPTELYDPLAAEACARVLETWDQCYRTDSALDVAPECQRVYTGTRAEGEPCLYLTEECAPGLACDITRTLHACGECVRAAALGEACGPLAPCDVPPERTLTCYLDVCEQVSIERDTPVGVRCGLVRNDADDLVRRSCALDTHCVGHPSSATCVNRALVGESCVEGETVCVHGAACLDAADGLRCRALEFVSVGEPCGDTARCNFRDREVCLDGVCTALGDGSLGAFCNSTASPYVWQCESGLECDDAMQRCVAATPLLAVGAACADDFECESGFCDRVTRVCAPATCL
jgi:hypothetical protein